MIKPAPEVEAAIAEPAVPQEAAAATEAMASSRVLADKAPTVSIAHACPPSEIGSFSAEAECNSTEQAKRPTLVETLRASNKIFFESIAAVIPGEAEKNILMKILPRVFDERSYVSFGEVKRYIAVVEGSCYIFADSTDPSPLYTIPLSNLRLMRENSSRPHFRSHTVSPEANTGLPRANQSRDTLGSVLLVDTRGKICFQLTFDSLISGEDVVDKFVSSIEIAKGKPMKK